MSELQQYTKFIEDLTDSETDKFVTTETVGQKMFGRRPYPHERVKIIKALVARGWRKSLENYYQHPRGRPLRGTQFWLIEKYAPKHMYQELINEIASTPGLPGRNFELSDSQTKHIINKYVRGGQVALDDQDMKQFLIDYMISDERLKYRTVDLLSNSYNGMITNFGRVEYLRLQRCMPLNYKHSRFLYEGKSANGYSLDVGMIGRVTPKMIHDIISSRSGFTLKDLSIILKLGEEPNPWMFKTLRSMISPAYVPNANGVFEKT